MAPISSRIRKRDSGGLSVFMDPIEFSQVLAVITAIAPGYCLEWGSGGSTRAILECCPFIEKYVSVEHDPDWYHVVAKSIKDERLSLNLVESDEQRPAADAPHKEFETWDHRAETDRSMMCSYVEFPQSLGFSFDFILVDGRSRSLCLREGYELLKTGGVMILHDAQRDDYQAGIGLFEGAKKLEPWKQGQICVIRKSTTDRPV